MESEDMVKTAEENIDAMKIFLRSIATAVKAEGTPEFEKVLEDEARKVIDAIMALDEDESH